jgi:predicted TPR repeat methyltransferase
MRRNPNAWPGYAVAASYRLAQGGCFRHSAAYAQRLAAETGFSVIALETIVHEHDQDDKPVAGLMAVLRRNSAIGPK